MIETLGPDGAAAVAAVVAFGFVAVLVGLIAVPNIRGARAAARAARKHSLERAARCRAGKEKAFDGEHS
jgi:hypothetical protein